MTLKTFFEKFDQFADAPDAVAKMRELVLLLAVQGKLVDQLPSDEPATKLLERIQKSKEQLIKERAIRRQETEPIDCDSAPFPIPQSWVWTRLGEIGDWGSGSTPPRGSHDLYDGGVTWLKSGELNDNLVLAGSSETVTELALKTGSFRRNQPGDVLFAMYGATIGKVAILAEPAVTNQAVCGCTPFEGVSNRYLFNYLVSQRTAFHEASEGGAQPNLSKVKIVAFPIPLPPLAEQKRIVAKVNELMALCDRLEAQQQERETRHAALARASLARFADAPTPANLPFLFHPSYAIPPADLRKSILTLAVQGKLVSQDPNDELADELLVRIQAERAEQEAKGAYKSSRPLEPIEETEEPFKLPVEWKWARLRSLVFTLGDGLHGTPEYSDGTDCYFINGNNLIDGRIVIKSHTKTVSLDEAKKHRKPMTLSTVLVSINGTLGSVAFYNNENVILGKSACYFNLASLVDKHFARRVIESPYFVNYALENATGTTIRNLGLKAMNYFPFPLPPLAEQRRIVAKIDQLMALVDALETQLAASRAAAANLLAALVAELTGTPNDGKVSVPTVSTTGRRGRPRKNEMNG